MVATYYSSMGLALKMLVRCFDQLTIAQSDLRFQESLTMPSRQFTEANASPWSSLSTRKQKADNIFNDVVRACLRGPEFPFLIKEVLRELTDQAWTNLNNECGVSTAEYGTGRVLLCDNSAERTLLATAQVLLGDGATSIGVEFLTEELAQHYLTNG